ncbi:MAG: hypothetical protein ABR579_10780 [Actinomycetota bacterium]
MKKLITGMVVAVLVGASSTALAGPATGVSTCQAVPVATPGITLLGKRVPSVSGIKVCVNSNTGAEVVPVVENQPACGSPCFAIRIDGLAVDEDITASVALSIDGETQVTTIDPGHIGVNPMPETSLCVVGVGTPDPCTDRVLPPTDVSARANRKGARRVALTWTAATATDNTTVAGYQVWRSTSGEDGTFQQIGTSTTTDFADQLVSKGHSYWYYVVAWNSAGHYSPASEVVTATVK